MGERAEVKAHLGVVQAMNRNELQKAPAYQHYLFRISKYSIHNKLNVRRLGSMLNVSLKACIRSHRNDF